MGGARCGGYQLQWHSVYISCYADLLREDDGHDQSITVSKSEKCQCKQEKRKKKKSNKKRKEGGEGGNREWGR